MQYDPFVRGPFPVGIRGARSVDAKRDARELALEVWYPPAPRNGGLDLNSPTRDSFTVLPNTPALQQAAVRDAAVHPGDYPLVLYSHASGGHRRQSSFLCMHLASHGYVVAAADHVGNTAVEAAESANRGAAGAALTQGERDAHIWRIIADLVPDLRFLVDEMLSGAAGDVSDQIDHERIGLIGWSFGGWAVLAAPEA